MAQIPSGPQASRLKSVKSPNTYATPKGEQTELHSPHSISEQGLEMHVFHGNNVEMGKQ